MTCRPSPVWYIWKNCKFRFIEQLRFSSVISSGVKRSREIRKYPCRRTDFSTRLRLGRNDNLKTKQLDKFEFED